MADYSIAFGATTVVDETISIGTDAFGGEFLGWESSTQPIDEMSDLFGITHLRWPGGIPAEDPWVSDDSVTRLEDPNLSELQYGDFAFCLTDPNFVDWNRWNGNERESLDDMLDVAAANGISSLAILVPTSRYVARMYEEVDGELVATSSIEQVLVTYAEDLNYFLDNLFFDENGLKPNLPYTITLEIGSEYYATAFWRYVAEKWESESTEITPEQLAASFGKIFAVAAETVGLYEAEHGIEINLAIQLGRAQSNDPLFGTAADSDIFLSELLDENLVSGKAIEAVDSVIWHRYTSWWDSIDDKLREDHDNSIQSELQKWEALGAGGEDGVGLVAGWMAPAWDQKVSESKYILAPMLQLFSELVAAGMDIGTAFDANAPREGALSWAGELTMAGQLYQMLAENTVGTTIHVDYQDNDGFLEHVSDEWTGGSYDDHVNQHTFSNEFKTVTYFLVGDLETEITINLNAIQSQYTNVEITHLYAGENVDWIYANPENPETAFGYGGSYSSYSYSLNDGTLQDNIEVTISNDYELVQVVAYNSCLSTAGKANLSELTDDLRSWVTDIELLGTGNKMAIGSEWANTIIGNSGHNRIWARDGDDVIEGRAGDDTIMGGTGNDSIGGGSGDDYLNGGFGHDKIWGGSGDDIMYLAGGSDGAWGKSGDDTIFGGGGNDWIYGGSGDDQIFGGGGADRFVFGNLPGDHDVIHDFEVNKDFIKITADAVSGLGDLTFDTTENGHLTVSYSGPGGAENIIELVGLGLEDFSQVEFLF